mgnify:CR=1 FL=1
MLDSYGPASSVADALGVYYLKNGFSADGGASDRWVRFAFGPLQIIFPNTDGRRRAIRHHDVHHITTAYQTTFIGEGEIGAWEIASGCATRPAAWFLNSVALSGGILGSPRRVLKAYARGLHTRNTYTRTLDDLGSLTVADLRHELGLDRDGPEPTLGETLAFGLVAVRSGLFCGLPALAIFLGPALITTAWVAARRSRP